MSECHRTKILLKGITIVFKTKGPQVRCIHLRAILGCLNVNQAAIKNRAVTKSKDMNKF